MELDQLQGPRFRLALERLLAGQSVTYGRLSLRLSEGALECDVPSSWQRENITQSTAEQDLSRAEQALQELVQTSSEMAGLVASHPPRLLLVDDYGKGACS